MKNFWIALALLVSMQAWAQADPRTYCGDVSVIRVLTGPRHGAMMQVSPSCGSAGGWVCLDPEGQFMSKEVSKRLFAQVLTYEATKQKFNLTVRADLIANACGSFPVVEDMRSAP
jgi:hypothetical protein